MVQHNYDIIQPRLSGIDLHSYLLIYVLTNIAPEILRAPSDMNSP